MIETIELRNFKCFEHERIALGTMTLHSLRHASGPAHVAEHAQWLHRFEDEHTFTRPDGERLLFSWHVRFTPEPGRIFFHTDPSTRRGGIGFIGRNGLPTVKSPT
jgi:hypothetical protein